jgi:DNA-binding NarL/FixJ family response regulator
MSSLLLVEDHTAFRQALAFMFEQETDVTVVAQAASLAEARLHLEGIDVALLDLDLPDGNGLDLIQPFRAANPRGAVLILTASTDSLSFARAVESGASGIVHKSHGIRDIIDATRRVSAGEFLLSPSEVIELLQLAGQQREQERFTQLMLSSLTAREHEVLQMLAEGLSDKDIARRLQISLETQRTHMVNILRKLGVDSRLQALVVALRHGAVTIH